MDKLKIDDLLKKINFDDYYIEATFQFKLLMQLGKKYDEDKIFPERSIKAYNLKDYTKKEIDIVIEQENNSNIAIELKMPMNGNGAVPLQMFEFIKDIKFLEELKTSNHFNKCYLIAVTNNKSFWQGSEMTEEIDIYKYFRNPNGLEWKNEILEGEIFKPTGEGEGEKSHKLNGKYNVQWNSLDNGFKYFVIEIEYSATEQRDIKDFSQKPASKQIPSTHIFATKNSGVLEPNVIKEEKLNTQMQYKVFNLNSEKYNIGLDKESGEIKVYKLIYDEYKHIYGEQKSIIIKKMAKIIENDVNNNFPDKIKKYVCDYQKDLDKSDSPNTRTLGKILFDYLNEDEKLGGLI